MRAREIDTCSFDRHAWEHYKRVDPFISFGGNVFSVATLLRFGLPVGALMA